MSCEFSKTHLIDYAYDELAAGEALKFEAHMRKCTACREEIRVLGVTRKFISLLPEEEISERLVFSQPPTRSFAEWWRDAANILPRMRPARFAFAGAAAGVVLLIAGALMNLRVDYGEQGFSVSMGLLPRPQTVVTASEKDAILAQLREENTRLVNELMVAEREKQMQRWDAKLTGFAREMELKRNNDLRLMEIGLGKLQRSSNVRFDEQNKVLKQFLRNASFERR